MTTEPSNGLELRSLITRDGTLRVSLEPVEAGEPGEGELIVRVEAAPINPSDIGLLLGPADISSFRAEGTLDLPVCVRSSGGTGGRATACQVPAIGAEWARSSLLPGERKASSTSSALAAISPRAGRTILVRRDGRSCALLSFRGAVSLPPTSSNSSIFSTDGSVGSST